MGHCIRLTFFCGMGLSQMKGAALKHIICGMGLNQMMQGAASKHIICGMGLDQMQGAASKHIICGMGLNQMQGAASKHALREHPNVCTAGSPLFPPRKAPSSACAPHSILGPQTQPLNGVGIGP